MLDVTDAPLHDLAQTIFKQDYLNIHRKSQQHTDSYDESLLLQECLDELQTMAFQAYQIQEVMLCFKKAHPSFHLALGNLKIQTNGDYNAGPFIRLTCLGTNSFRDTPEKTTLLERSMHAFIDFFKAQPDFFCAHLEEQPHRHRLAFINQQGHFGELQMTERLFIYIDLPSRPQQIKSLKKNTFLQGALLQHQEQKAIEAVLPEEPGQASSQRPSSLKL